MNSDRSKFAVVYGTDTKYLPLVCFSIHSISTSNEVMPDVYILALGINDSEIQKAEEYLQSLGVRVTIISIPKNDFVLGESKKLNPAIVYLFIKLGDYIPNSYERVLTLDADTRVVHDLTPLFEMNLQGKTVAAANDIISFSKEPYQILKKKLGLSETQEYFNTGVMLIDLLQWNEKNLGDRIIQYAKENADACTHRDQCAINKLLADDWLPFDIRWNYYTPHFPEERTPFIYHFPKHTPWRRLKGRKATEKQSLFAHHLWYCEVAKNSPWPKAVRRRSVILAQCKIYLKRKLAEIAPFIQNWIPSISPSQKKWDAEKLTIFDQYAKVNDPTILRNLKRTSFNSQQPASIHPTLNP